MRVEPIGVNTTADAPPREKRSYRGHSPAARTEGRRERLLQAAVSVYGEYGFHATTVQAICSAAGLTKRYFYESFTDSEALLAACFRKVSSTLIAELAGAVEAERPHPEHRAKSILTAYFRAIQADPVRARLFLLETDGLNPDLLTAMYQAQGLLADLIINDGAGCRTTDPTKRLQTAGAIAGVARISVIWVAESCATPLAAVVEGAQALFNGLLPPPGPLLVFGG